MNLKIFNNSSEIAKFSAEFIIKNLKNNQKLKNKFVLGLATGSSPIETYQNLIKDFKKNQTNWNSTIFFNLDEYIGLKPTDSQSYSFFMRKHLFDDLKVDSKNTFIPKGVGNYEEYANKYDSLIKSKGGIDLLILGLGVNGHIGFNEPPSDFNSTTHIVELTPKTIQSNSKFFKNGQSVPKKAVSMGIKSIMNAKKIILIAYGESKADAINKLINGKIDKNYPCSILQQHNDVTIVIDKVAGKLLKSIKS